MCDDISLASVNFQNPPDRWRVLISFLGAGTSIIFAHILLQSSFSDIEIYSALISSLVLGSIWDHSARKGWSLKQCVAISFVSAVFAVVIWGATSATLLAFLKGQVEKVVFLGSILGLIAYLLSTKRLGG